VSRARPPSGAALFSVGHGTATEDELLGRLAAADLAARAGIRLLVDVRTAPGSRRHPHLARERLEQWLPSAGIGYRWDPRLGGFRRPAADSPDVVWENASFRGYAGHLRTDQAREALADLVEEGRAQPTAFLCSETLWWRCHRRLVADALVLLHGADVHHLMPGRVTAHRPTAGARRLGDVLVYDDVDAAGRTART
jgi:uncharacterized protein (DUF488 family)